MRSCIIHQLLDWQSLIDFFKKIDSLVRQNQQRTDSLQQLKPQHLNTELNLHKTLWVGLMSGTSTDGIDAVAACFDQAQQRVEVLAHRFYPFSTSLRDSLLCLQDIHHNWQGQDPFITLEATGNQLSELYAAACIELLTHVQVKEFIARQQAIIPVVAGAHGQTIRHQPNQGITIQHFNPSLFYALTGVPVVYDFRRMDVALGGQGAPLVPAFHQWWMQPQFQKIDKTQNQCSIVVLNIGGFSNLSICRLQGVEGFDVGPGNVLLDGWIARHQGLPYDDQGAWAASGKVIKNLYNELSKHPFFTQKPPKSTGRDDFDLAWLDQVIDQTSEQSSVKSSGKIQSMLPADVQATLLELTAQCIVQALPYDCKQVVVCGGGVKNTALMKRFVSLRPRLSWLKSSDFGVDAMQVEALAFAWLAYQRMCGLPGNVCEVTGASRPAILGVVAGF
jgi:anhydro-N-acetylmuramic acid kinase